MARPGARRLCGVYGGRTEACPLRGRPSYPPIAGGKMPNLAWIG